MKTASAETERDSVSSRTDERIQTRLPRSVSASARPALQAFAWAGLIWTLIRTDFKARYYGTFGGFVWALLKPLCMFFVLMAVFSFLFASDPTYKLDLIIGLFLWEFFAEATKTGLSSLQSKGFLLTKARFPSWILVITSISNALITLAVFNIVIVTFLVADGHPPTVRAAVVFLAYCAALVLIVVGFSLASSVLFVRYRDLNQVWDVVVQAGFFVAPIVYPLDIIPERFHLYLYFWPPTPIIEFSRVVLVHGSMATRTAHLCLATAVVICLAAGAFIFHRLAPRAAEYL
jgi:lipopolysaccharide transport system permease protein